MNLNPDSKPFYKNSNHSPLDEIDASNKKIENLMTKIKEKKNEQNEIHDIRLREKEILMEENRNIIRELKLLNLIIEHFVPQEEIKKLENKLEFNEDIDEWTIKDLQDETIKIKKPGSALGLKYPLCEFSRMASIGDDNPR